MAHDRNFPILLKTFHLLIYALYNSTKIYNCLNSIYHSSLISPLSLEVCPYLHASFTSLFRPGIILESILFAAEEKIDKLQNDLQKMVEHLQTFMEVKDQHKSQVRSNLCFDLQTFQKNSVFHCVVIFTFHFVVVVFFLCCSPLYLAFSLLLCLSLSFVRAMEEGANARNVSL